MHVKGGWGGAPVRGIGLRNMSAVGRATTAIDAASDPREENKQLKEGGGGGGGGSGGEGGGGGGGGEGG